MTEATTAELFIGYPAENAVAAREIRSLIE